MKGGKNKHSLGYTIVEVMIVLAISGVMFLIAATFINGKQATTAFNQGVNGLASNIQDVIDQVANGRYADIPQPTCIVPSNNVGALSFSGSLTGQGQNVDCVLLGKVIQFNEADNQTKYQLLTVAGARLDAGQPVSSLDDADVTAITPPASANDLTVQQAVPQSLDVQQVKVTLAGGATLTSDYNIASSPGTNYAAAFIQGLGSVNNIGDYLSGTQTVGLYYVTFNKSTTIAKAITNNFGQLSAPIASTISWCVTDGSRYATVSVGENNNQLGVNTQLGLSSCP